MIRLYMYGYRGQVSVPARVEFGYIFIPGPTYIYLFFARFRLLSGKVSAAIFKFMHTRKPREKLICADNKSS